MIYPLTDYPSVTTLELLYCTLIGKSNKKILDSNIFLQYTLRMAKRGRPKLDAAKREVLQVRVLPEVKREFEQASRLCKQSLSKWATEQLREAAHKVLQNNRPKADDSP